MARVAFVATLVAVYAASPIRAGAQDRTAPTLREPTTVTVIRFVGHARYRDAKLRGLVPQKVGEPVDWVSVRQGQDAIEALYHQDGFDRATVRFDPEELGRTGELVYTISEGTRQRIREVLFEGNHAFDAHRLRRIVRTKKAFWIFGVGAFDEEQVESDVRALRRFYRDEGFLEAEASYRKRVSASGEHLSLVFLIEEGLRYSVESIDFGGNTIFSDEELLAMIESRVGATVKLPQLDTDARAILTRYGELGYIDATVRPIRPRFFLDRPDVVALQFELDEGDQYRVGRVIVRGNTRTRDKVVRRALNLYPPDDLFDLTEAREAERRLRETEYFSSARVYPVGDAPGVRDVVIDVQETDRPDQFIVLAGVTSNAGLIGSFRLDLKNFDLSDWPRSWTELRKFRSFFGGGQRLQLELSPGTQVSTFHIRFTEPYLMDRPVRLHVNAFLFERGRDGYTEGRRGVTVSFGKRFDRGRLRGWSGELSFRVEQVSVEDLDLLVAREIRAEKGTDLLTSGKVTLVRDRTDNRFVPTRGDRLRLSYEQYGVLGGDHGFGKLSAGYTWYKTLSVDARDRKRVLQLRAEGGVIIGDAPIYERFYAGGTGSIRGYEFRGIGEYQGIGGNNVGGDFLFLGGAEYSFPLFGEGVRGLFFLDTAAVGSGGLRASIGTGVRFTLNLLGPVPIQLNLALPINSQDGDDTKTISFLFGRSF